jgi:hypothetical protein
MTVFPIPREERVELPGLPVNLIEVMADSSRELARRTRYVGGTLFLMTASFLLVKTARDALYFQAGGIYHLPFAYIGIAVLSVPMAVGMLTLMRAVGARRARIASPLILAAVLSAFAAVARPGGGILMTAFFMLIPLAYGVILSLAWLLGADLLHLADQDARARAYSRLAAAALAGSVAGALTARLLAARMDPSVLLVVGAALLLASTAIAAAAQRRCPARTLPMMPKVSLTRPLEDGLAWLARNRQARVLLAIGLFTSLAGILIEFQFYIAAAASGNSGRDNAAFFATLYFALNAAALVVQVVVAPRVQNRLGLIGGLLVLPGTLIGLTPLAILNGSLWTRSTMRLTEGAVKSSIHRINWEQSYLLISANHRATAKLLVDGAAAHIAEGLASLLLLAWLALIVRGEDLGHHDASWITYFLLLALLAWVMLTRALGRAHADRQAMDLGTGEAVDARLPDS